jgi:beta-N-acetylhexosaminidase
MLDGILRRKMGFNGVILADDLGMGAIARQYGSGEAAIETLRAGTDIAMLCHDWKSVAPAIAAVRKAQGDGRFDEGEWRSSIERIETVCNQADLPMVAAPLEKLGCDEHQTLAAAVRARLR